MSFDIFYEPCRFGTGAIESRNPFTGEMQATRPVEPLSDDDARAVRGVLAAAGAGGLDELEHRIVALADGGEAEVVGNDPSGGLMVMLRGFTPDLFCFLFELLDAADWAMLPAMAGNPAIVTRPGRAGDRLADFPGVVCGSPESLGKILAGGFEAWAAYRDQDQVVSGSNGGSAPPSS